MSIAFLGCRLTMPQSPDRRADAFEHDELIGALRAGLDGSGIAVTDRDWRAPIGDFADDRLVLIGTAWDYVDAPDAFHAQLGALAAAGKIVCNPPAMLRWNSDKHYLAELERAGAPSIPTLWHDDPDAAAIKAAFDTLGTDRLVVKRRVGAGAIGQHSFTRDAPPPDGWHMGAAAMIQPFLPAIVEEGEFSLIYVDGQYSHALIKRAAAGDYRIQSLYGGREERFDPAPEDRARAEAVLALLPFDEAPLYARIDMVRGADGALALIEAELIEPYLYPLQDERFGKRLADAVLRRLG